MSLLSVGVSLGGLLMALSGLPQELSSGGIIWLAPPISLLWLWVLWRGWKAPSLWRAPPLALLTCVALILLWSASWLIKVALVLITLTATRLIALKRTSDFKQLTLLSFGHITLSVHLESSLLFGLLLIPYLALITLTLTLTHLRADLDSEPSRERLARLLNSKRLLPRGLLAGLSLVGLVLCGLALLFFFVLPRVGGTGWSSSVSYTQGRAGFSDEVSLAEVSALQQDERVAFRVKVSRPSLTLPFSALPFTSPAVPVELEELLPMSERYWVGRRLDHYEAGRWRQVNERFVERFAPSDHTPKGDVYWLASSPKHTSTRFTLQELFIEPRDHSALFSLSEPLALRVPRTLPPRPLLTSDNHTTRYEWDGPLSYEVLSVQRPLSALLSAPLAQYRAEAEAITPYPQLTQLPPSLTAPLGALARELAREAQSAGEAAAQLTAHLRGSFKYSLTNLKPPTLAKGEPPLDPVLYFLQESKAGHCQYFSAALALMLRSLGLPARVVVGYYGGRPSSAGGTLLTVYQRDAHAWVELWAGGDPRLPSSWARYDPTPAAPERAREVSALRRWRDELSFLWARYVVGFEVSDQAKALDEGARGAARLALWWAKSDARAALMWALAPRQLLTLVALIALMWALWRTLAVWRSGRGLGALLKALLKVRGEHNDPNDPNPLTTHPSRANSEGSKSSKGLRGLLKRSFNRLSPGERPPIRRLKVLSDLLKRAQELCEGLCEGREGALPPQPTARDLLNVAQQHTSQEPSIIEALTELVACYEEARFASLTTQEAHDTLVKRAQGALERLELKHLEYLERLNTHLKD